MKSPSASIGYRGTGFSLVEVTLALGIASFSLVVMLGIFGSVVRVRGDNVGRQEAYTAAYALQSRVSGPGAFNEAYNWVKGGSKELVYVRYKVDDSGTASTTGERYRAGWFDPTDLTPDMESAVDGRWIKATLKWDPRDHINPVALAQLPANAQDYTQARATLIAEIHAVPTPTTAIAAGARPTLTTSLTLHR